MDENYIQQLADNNEESYKNACQWRKKVGAPMSKEIEVLNLVMKKCYALSIMKGEKTVEYRQYSDFYINRLYDKDVMKFHEEHKENEEIDGEYGRYGMLDAIRRVRKIHFHDYSNTWYMDVEVLDNNYIYLNKKDQEGMNEVYDDQELGDMVKKLEEDGVSEEERPLLFYFVISRVIDTNLK